MGNVAIRPTLCENWIVYWLDGRREDEEVRIGVDVCWWVADCIGSFHRRQYRPVDDDDDGSQPPLQ